MSKTIAILGATGTQGASVVDAFLASSDWRIRALSRNPNSKKAQAIPKSDRITITRADTSSWPSSILAFEGRDAILAMTDYWAPFANPALREAHAVGPDPGKALREWAYNDEIEQGKKIAKAAAVCAVNGKLTHFIWSGLPSPKKYSNREHNGIYHFDSKDMITEYVREFIRRWPSSLMKPIKQKDGTFLVQRLCDGDAKHPFRITRHGTGPLVKALTEAEPGKILLGYTDMMSWKEMTEMWAQATMQSATFREVSLEDFKKEFPVEGEELLRAKYSAKFGYAGRDPEVLDPTALGFEDEPHAIEAWMGKQDWSSVLSSAPTK